MRDLQGALERYGYHCITPDPKTLVGPAIRQAVFDAARELGPDDLLVVHLLSHGGLTKTGRLALVDAAGRVDPVNSVGDWVRDFADTPSCRRRCFWSTAAPPARRHSSHGS
ncbi:caspase family protein [Phytohabitans houttuyneae]|uniref:Caspase family p20 domain-containing protein n=1 Tax=Phytohabitans houttuyneae TaxID=1076126 RepID=A0A6V8KDF6_9ACTN|nr:caspase family protein [Phytohabitans houttuyneae]GFJ81470.1 hypothetical protein Phou_056500 [Phytohabitans houttuyneae]